MDSIASGIGKVRSSHRRRNDEEAEALESPPGRPKFPVNYFDVISLLLYRIHVLNNQIRRWLYEAKNGKIVNTLWEYIEKIS